MGIWGAMSDISHLFKPWEDGFSKGLYLAGVECVDNAEAPDGWTKWIILSYEYIVVENHNGVFEDTIRKYEVQLYTDDRLEEEKTLIAVYKILS